MESRCGDRDFAVWRKILFPRAIGQAVIFARTAGKCREGQGFAMNESLGVG